MAESRKNLNAKHEARMRTFIALNSGNDLKIPHLKKHAEVDKEEELTSLEHDPGTTLKELESLLR